MTAIFGNNIISNALSTNILCALFMLTLLLPTKSFGEIQKGDFVRGSKIWARTCNKCHNMRDPGDFSDEQWRPVMFHMMVRAGMIGQETRDVLKFLQDSNMGVLVKNTAPQISSPVVKTTGKSVFLQTCVACHGANGKGTIPGSPDFTAKDSPLKMKKKDELVANVINGFKSPGSPMAMPPKGGNQKLTDQEAYQVVEYILDEFGK